MPLWLFILIWIAVIAAMAVAFHNSNRTLLRAVKARRIESFRKRLLRGDYDNHPSNHSREER